MTSRAPETATGFLDRLNEAQRAAVLHGDSDGAGPMLIIAGAGTGKTETLAHCIARRIVLGADPRRILAVTFTRRAATELNRRIERILGAALGDRAAALAAGLTWVGTFHSIAVRILREHAAAIGLDPQFTVHDRGDSADLLNMVRHRLGLANTEARFPEKATCLAIYSRAVNACEPLAPVLATNFPVWTGWEEELKQLFAAYVEAKQASQVLDYDDLLLYWAEMLSDAAAAAALGSAFDHVFVDEYQDTNRLQAKILLALKPDGRGVTVVGDDAQAIYGFRAAEVRNILDFPHCFDPPARVVTLEKNYRSTSPILAAGNAVIGEAREGFAKTLWSARPSDDRPRLVATVDETAQVDYVCRQVLAIREDGTPLNDQAVLFRASHHSAELELELTRRNIPFVKFGGLKFLEAAHVKDLLAVLRFAENPRDRVSGFRVLTLMPGIGATTATDILDRVTAATGASLADIKVPPRAAKAWADFVQLFALLQRGMRWPAEVEAAQTWYQPHLERRHDDAAARSADLVQLVRLANGFASRTSFLTELTLDPPQSTSDLAEAASQDEDHLVLSTIHSAKGQEWRSVFVLNCIEGCIPSERATGSDAEVEEERRLLYVAMTRARDALHLMMPLRLSVGAQAAWGDRTAFTTRSRFLPPHVLDTLEQPSWKPKDGPVGESARSLPPRDLKVGMRGMWA